MHPRASKERCGGKIIDSHTIQRKGPLQKLVDVNNRVCNLNHSAKLGNTAVEEIGWRQASVFPGYCAKHDSEIFADLEQFPFTGTHEQCVLQTYRNVCNELYKKRAAIDSLIYQGDVIDRGLDLDGQIEQQLIVSMNIQGQTKSKDELESLWKAFDGAVSERRYDRFSSKCYFFEGDLSVTSSGALHVEFDFRGTKLVDMWDLNVNGEMLSHSIMSTDRGGAIVFTWLSEQELPALVVNSFDTVPDEHKGDVFVQYCFLNCENTYFSRAWWDQLGDERHAQRTGYAKALFYEGGAFVPNLNSLVDWKFPP